MDGHSSRRTRLRHGVPQGSVLCALLFTPQCAGLSDVFAKQTMTHIVLTFHLMSLRRQPTGYPTVSWTGVALATFNEAKTWAILFAIPNHRIIQPRLLPIDICRYNVITSANIHDPDVHLDSTLSMTAHVSRTCQTAYVQLRCIAQIRSALTLRACTTIVHARGAWRLGFGKTALYTVLLGRCYID